MLETTDLILDKAKYSDWEGMYRNVWSRPESARHMLWNLTTSEEDARIRIQESVWTPQSLSIPAEKKMRRPLAWRGRWALHASTPSQKRMRGTVISIIFWNSA